MTENFRIETLDNGLTVICERIPHLQSGSYALHIPSGVFLDDPERIGASLVLAELSSRGAGSYDSKQLSDAFDSLGVRRTEGAGLKSTYYNGSALAENVPKALELVSLMVQKPRLPESDLERVKSLLLQDLQALFDNPAKRVVAELRKRYFPDPYGRMSLGSEEGIKKTSIHDVRKLWESKFTPKGSVLSIAGNVACDDAIAWARESFGAWGGEEVLRPPLGEINRDGNFHISEDSAQVQIAIAFPAASFGDPDYYVTRVICGILSGGMFGRLFVEVREKRGLCYSVYASHFATDMYGVMIIYAGTTPERAQETVDVICKEIWSLKGTVGAEELKRAKANLKASLVMSQESGDTRASSNATDWWWLKRVRSLEEIEQGIVDVTPERIDNYLERFPSDKVLMVTLGKCELKFPSMGR